MGIIIALCYGFTVLLGVAALAIQILLKRKNIDVIEGNIKGNTATVFFSLIVFLNLANFLEFFFWKFKPGVSMDVLYVVTVVFWLILGYYFIEFEREFAGEIRKAWVRPFFCLLILSSLFLEVSTETDLIDMSMHTYYNFYLLIQTPIWLYAVFCSIRYTIRIYAGAEKLNQVVIVIYDIVFLISWMADSLIAVHYRAGGNYLVVEDISSIFVWVILSSTNLYFVWKSCNASENSVLKTETDLEKLRQRYNLSDREKRIAGLLVEGKSNLEIAGELDMSESAVKVHNHRLYKKLGAENRVQAVNLIREIQ